MTGTNIAVTVSRLPDSVLEELETSIAELHDEYDLDPDQMHILQVLIMGYGAAWDAVERLQQQLKQEQELSENIVDGENRGRIRLEQQVNTLTEALERIVALAVNGRHETYESEIARKALQSIKESPREEQEPEKDAEIVRSMNAGPIMPWLDREEQGK